MTPSSFGGDDVFTAWARFMCEQGTSQEAAVSQASCGASFLPTLFHSQPATSVLPEVEDQALESGLAVSQDLVETRHVEVGLPSLLAGTYVVSILKKGRFKRLHRIGECSLVPGVDYRAFEVLGSEEPGTALYSTRCRNCFKAQPICVHASEATDSSSEASSAES